MSIDVHLYFGHNVTEGDVMFRLQDLLGSLMPGWTAKLHEHRGRAAKIPVPLGRRDALLSAVLRAGAERGPIFDHLNEQLGRGSARHFGSAEFRGAPGVTMIVRFDDEPFPRIGSSVLWGNSITFQIRRATVEQSRAAELVTRLFRQAAIDLAPWYGHAEATAEFDANNILSENLGTTAVGLDLGKALPGIYWLNFFGSPLCDVLHCDSLDTTAAAFRVDRLRHGVLVQLSAEPKDWRSQQYRELQSRMIENLGADYFFDRSDTARSTGSILAHLRERSLAR